jgi:hypothetical protein
MQTVLIHTPFAPPEWILAHGFDPLRAKAPIAMNCSCQEGLCSVAARAMEHRGLAIFATTCDQLRRAHDEVEQGFLLDVPAAWQSVVAQKLWREELRRLGRWLIRHGGHEPENLLTLALEQDRKRAAFREKSRVQLGDPREVRLAVLGGPLPENIPDLIVQAGGLLALDASETGERGLAPPLDLRLLQEDPFEAVAAAHLAIPDPSRRPDTTLHQWLATEISERSIQGLVLCADPWCDQWQLQEQRLRHHAPVLTIDTGDNPARILTRLQAFCEMLA